MTIEEAEKIIYRDTPIEYIYRITQTKDFIEFVGDAGGDILTYRVHNNGKVYAK
jgi:hypothetical protein